MEEIIRFMPPVLGAVLAWVFKTELVPGPKNPVENWNMWKPIGLLVPALWLTGIGPNGLVLHGGFLMRLLHADRNDEVSGLQGGNNLAHK